MGANISIELDTRRKKVSGKYPAKVRVYCDDSQQVKLYSTKLDFTEEEFAAVYLTKKPKKEHVAARKKLDRFKAEYQDLADKLEVFTFEEFDRKIKRDKGDGQDVVYHYQQYIDKLERNGQVVSASSYQGSLNSLKEYIEHGLHKEASRIPFRNITPVFLQDYERYMSEVKGRSKATIGIYLRNLRAIFNAAIAQKEISQELYPFGHRKYTIPSPRAVKKALTEQQVSALLWAVPATAAQQMAKAFFFFSYVCNGINMKDIALLRYKNIQGDYLVFTRAKTSNTRRDSRPIRAYLHPYTLEVISKYGNPNKDPESFIFPILKPGLTPKQVRDRVHDFTRRINKHIRKLAASIGLPHDIGTYFARHSFTTIAIQKGASLEQVQEGLGHADKRTTMNYFGGFHEDSQRELAQKLMDF